MDRKFARRNGLCRLDKFHSYHSDPVSYTHLDVYKRQPYVNVPNDLSKIKTKMAFNLTKRQLICFGGAAAIGIPSYLLAREPLGNTGAMFLMPVSYTHLCGE